MAKLTLDISMSLDGFVAGPNQTLDEPLGKGGEQLHEWAFAARSWRESHGLSGGETNADSEVIDEHLRNTGATVMGRRMFSGGEGPRRRQAVREPSGTRAARTRVHTRVIESPAVTHLGYRVVSVP